MLRSRLVEPDSPLWLEALSGLEHDVYHLPGYAALFAREEGGTAFAFVAEEGDERLVLPLIVRPVDPTGPDGGHWFDTTCPYGYPGPVWCRGSSPTRDEFLSAPSPRWSRSYASETSSAASPASTRSMTSPKDRSARSGPSSTTGRPWRST